MVIWETIGQINKQCFTFYSLEQLSWIYDQKETCKTEDNILIVISTTFVIMTAINGATLIKIIMFYKVPERFLISLSLIPVWEDCEFGDKEANQKECDPVPSNRPSRLSLPDRPVVYDKVQQTDRRQVVVLYQWDLRLGVLTLFGWVSCVLDHTHLLLCDLVRKPEMQR